MTKVVLQQRHKIKGSVTKVTESLVFLELPIQLLFDPVRLVSSKLYYARVKQWSVKVVAKNFRSALWYYIISTVFLWINYYYNFF